MFEGAGAQLSYGLELAYGVPGGTEVFSRFVSEDMMPSRPFEEAPDIDPSREVGTIENLRVDTKGKFKSSVDVNTILRERIHQHRWYQHTTPVAGVQQWVVRKEETSDTPVTDYLDSMYFNIYRDDDNAHLITGAVYDEVTLRVAENKFLDLERSLIFGRDTHMEDPAGTDPGFTGQVVVYGHRNDPESTDDLKMKVIVGGALDGTATVSFTKGATAYGATTYPVVSGQLIKVLLADGSPAGSTTTREHVYVMFLEGDPGDVLTATTEWVIDPVRGVAVPSYSTAQRLTAVEAEGSVTLNGTTKTYAIHNLELKIQTPQKPNGGLGSKYLYGVLNNGKRHYVMTLQRDYTDLDFYRALVVGRNAVVNVPIYGARIGSTAHYETWQLEMLNARIKQGGANVGNPNALPERIDIEAVRSAGWSGPIFRETIKNTVATL